MNHTLYWIEYFIQIIVFLGSDEFCVCESNDQVGTCLEYYRNDWSLFQYIKNSVIL